MASMANTVVVTRRRLTITPFGATVIGSGNMTAASPIVITVASHGLSSTKTEYVSFSGITQSNWTALNGTTNKITYLTANTFSIAVDGSGFGAYTDGAGAVYQDFATAKYFPHGMRWSGGEFKGQANDELIVREYTYNNAVIGPVMDVVETGNGKELKIGGRSIKAFPHIMMSEQRFGDVAKVFIILEMD